MMFGLWINVLVISLLSICQKSFVEAKTRIEEFICVMWICTITLDTWKKKKLFKKKKIMKR